MVSCGEVVGGGAGEKRLGAREKRLGALAPEVPFASYVAEEEEVKQWESREVGFEGAEGGTQ